MHRPSSLLQSANALAGSGLPTDGAFQLPADLETAFQSWPRPGASQQQTTQITDAAMQVSDTWSIPTSVDSSLRTFPQRYVCIQRCQARLTTAALPTMHRFTPSSLWSPDKGVHVQQQPHWYLQGATVTYLGLAGSCSRYSPDANNILERRWCCYWADKRGC